MRYVIKVEHRNGDISAERENKERALIAGRWLCKAAGTDAQSVRVYRRVQKRLAKETLVLVATFTYLVNGRVAMKLGPA